MISITDDVSALVAEIFEVKENRASPVEMSDYSIVTLLSSLVSKMKAVELLQAQKETDEIPIIARSYIEQYVSLKYILQRYTNERGTAFFIHQRYDSYAETSRILEKLEDDKLAKALKVHMDRMVSQDDSSYSTFNEARDYYIKRYNGLFEAALERGKMPKKQSVEELSEHTKQWYNTALDGTETFSNLCKKAKCYELYTSMYAPLSMDVHGSNTPANMTFQPDNDPSSKFGTFLLKSARDSEGLLKMQNSLLMETTLDVAKHYLIPKDKLPNNLLQKYVVATRGALSVKRDYPKQGY